MMVKWKKCNSQSDSHIKHKWGLLPQETNKSNFEPKKTGAQFLSSDNSNEGFPYPDEKTLGCNSHIAFLQKYSLGKIPFLLIC